MQAFWNSHVYVLWGLIGNSHWTCACNLHGWVTTDNNRCGAYTTITWTCQCTHNVDFHWVNHGHVSMSKQLQKILICDWLFWKTATCSIISDVKMCAIFNSSLCENVPAWRARLLNVVLKRACMNTNTALCTYLHN